MTWPTTAIPVCWENGTSAEAKEWKKIWQDVVTKEYGKTILRFVQWNTCDAASGGIRIEIYGDEDIEYRPKNGVLEVFINHQFAYTRGYRLEDDGHPRSGIGVVKGALPGNMILNIQLKNVHQGLTKITQGLASGEAKRNLLRTIMLHELGHRIGLNHEQARPDSACQGEIDSNKPVYGGVLLGAFDPNSIMNYCVTHASDYKSYIPLSAGDVAAINELYRPSRLAKDEQQ